MYCFKIALQNLSLLFISYPNNRVSGIVLGTGNTDMLGIPRFWSSANSRAFKFLSHSYYNVWLRAQLGWKSFLLRRDAVNKIKSLPLATKEQLEKHNDICAICYQVTHTIRVHLGGSNGVSLGTLTILVKFSGSIIFQVQRKWASEITRFDKVFPFCF